MRAVHTGSEWRGLVHGTSSTVDERENGEAHNDRVRSFWGRRLEGLVGWRDDGGVMTVRTGGRGHDREKSKLTRTGQGRMNLFNHLLDASLGGRSPFFSMFMV